MCMYDLLLDPLIYPSSYSYLFIRSSLPSILGIGPADTKEKDRGPCGYSAFPIPASQSTAENKELYEGLFQHKTPARLSGLGFIGKSGLFISKEYGSKIRLATVLTNAPFESDNKPIESMCKGCNLCVLACPAGAISGKEYVEGMMREEFFSAEKCSHNMKNYKDIGRGAVCGICIKVCPFNKLK